MARIQVYVLAPKDSTSADNSVFEELFFSPSVTHQIAIGEKRGPIPISYCYIEVAVVGLTWAAQGVLGALAYDLIKTLGRGIKSEYDKWTLAIRSENCEANVLLDRVNEEESTKKLHQALEKLAEAQRTSQTNEK
jgi:hypothetical protein